MRRLLLVTLLVTLLPATPAAAHGIEGAITHRDTRDELAFVDVAATAAAAAVPDALPYEWCGDARTTDDSAHATLPASSPRFKLVYAHPADRPDRFDGWRDALQGNVALIQRFLASQSGGAKALRVDMGTSCGPQFVDIQVVHLSGPRSQYVDNFSAVVREVEPRLGQAGGPRNVVILADTLNGGGYDYGLGENVLGSAGDRRGVEQRAQLRRLRLGAVLARRASRPGRRRPQLVAGGLPARDEPQPRRRAVVGPAQHAAARLQPPALRPLLAGRRRHVLHGGLRRRAPDAVRLPARRRCHPAGLRLRSRRLLQPGPAGRQLPGLALERLRQRLPRAVRAGRTRVRRRHRRPRPQPAGQHRGAGAVGLAAPRLQRRRAQRRVAQRAADLQLPLAASTAQALDEHLRRAARVLRPDPQGPRPPAARPGRGHQPGRQRLSRLGAERPRGRRHGRPRAELQQRSVLQGPSSTACCQVPRS